MKWLVAEQQCDCVGAVSQSVPMLDDAQIAFTFTLKGGYHVVVNYFH